MPLSDFLNQGTKNFEPTTIPSSKKSTGGLSDYLNSSPTDLTSFVIFLV